MNIINKPRIATVLLVCVGISAGTLSWSALAIDIRVVGLFGNRALIEIDGKQHFLRVGQTSPEGVKLLESSSKGARVEHEGKRHTLGLSEHIASNFSEARQAEVNLVRGDYGHYFGSGAINGYPFDFMVDTGASSIAMNSQHAKRLGLKLERKNRGAASTAGGMVQTYQVMLNKVSVGGITHYNIPAAVIEGNYPEVILLGNSFLAKVEMTEQNGVMVLREK
ncbi:MAG: TIGR02281 family clan AA aspartic protease [Porticoccaceae bacterium]|nr:TIGR02281 family clan AA aspartic protease [Porticoccaceae bacterium]